MTLEQAQEIVEKMEQEGLECSLFENYSGRNGVTGTGIVTSDPKLVHYTCGLLEYPPEDLPQRMDNLGCDFVLY